MNANCVCDVFLSSESFATALGSLIVEVRVL